MNEAAQIALVNLVTEATSHGESGGEWQTSEQAVKAALEGKPYDGRGMGVYQATLDLLELLNKEEQNHVAETTTDAEGG